MSSATAYQIVISGVGGQGVLFITRLLAEAAMGKGLPVFTSETHGMAQRGGTVISHLKVGPFQSPLVRPGQADGLLALKSENLSQHAGYLRTGAWAVINSPEPLERTSRLRLLGCDADRLARQLNDPRSVNLILLGFALRAVDQRHGAADAFFCDADDLVAVLNRQLWNRPSRLASALAALRAGAESEDVR